MKYSLRLCFRSDLEIVEARDNGKFEEPDLDPMVRSMRSTGDLAL